jgi:DNA-binding transcriptional regulator YdaS (Cro superfamily)
MWYQTANFRTGINPTHSLSLADAWQLWNYRGNNRSVAYLTGISDIFPLTQIWQARMAIAGVRTHTIDCAIRFNTYTIAEEALRQSVAPESIADSITVTRAFTPYQILDAVKELKKNEVVFVLAPAKQFFDGDVAFDEGLFLIQKLVRFFADAHERGVALFVVERPSYACQAKGLTRPVAAPAFSTFLSEMKQLTWRSRWELSPFGASNGRRLRITEGHAYRDILSLPAASPQPRLLPVRAPVNMPPAQMQFSF